MEAALHGQYVYTAKFPEDELAAMSFDGGYWEVGNVLIGELLFFSYFGS